MYKCLECGQPCELIEVDDGGLEEIWGAMIWHEMLYDYSECCSAEYEEIG